MEISKELLSAIFCRKICYVESDGNTIKAKGQKLKGYGTIDVFHGIDEINIYELAHKCKEWAATKGYILFSKTRLSSSLASCYFDIMGIHDYEDDFHNDFRAETEPDAIFKACQWILENYKENKC